MLSKYTPTIGLEIHAELKTNSKMFSNAKNNPDEERPNVNINPIDLGHPGTLPTINKKAVEHVIKVGLAVGGEIANFTEFDRKNYFYPDIPKGYQISQYKYPIVSGGEINGVKITRIHLEEDTGLSKHDRGDFSLVDYNRAGIPLMELVTEPVIHSAKQAVDFAKNLQMLLRYLGAGDANMEKGEMRVEVNISLSDTKELGTKVEIKNLNSFKVVEKSIEYEIKRMTELLEAGRGDEIVQETRGWDENKEITFSQRRKETSDDYRYFPEPDLPKMMLHEVFNLDALKEQLPELPWQKKERLTVEVGLNEEAADIFVSDLEMSQFFDQIVGDTTDIDFIKLTSNYITSDLVSLRKEGGQLPSAENFSNLIKMIMANEVSSRGAKDILAMMVKEDKDPKEIAEKEGLLQQSDEGALKEIVQKIINDNQKVVEEYKGGKEASLQFLIGQGMKETKGSANPQILKDLFLEELK
ncbi:Asp-tRNA(Asn)/Glu-tRNA(Gln) amidotransferase subunit GatB [Candidatus Nomurabacteria bacterium]|nr:Asp-tRNA(Asn)/Glu-tRNA(Gln) amidotransferase subunit GatB [Candidatus Nomurabacteria bacterium]